MTSLRLRLFGGFELEGASGLPLARRKAEAVLAYLALPAGRAHPRDELVALLWGNRSDNEARHSLRQILYLLRKTLAADGALIVDDRTVTLDPSQVDVDVTRFETSAALGTPDALAEAVGLYQGELLAGFDIREDEFEDWLLGERERLRELVLDAHERLLQHQVGVHDDVAATETARRLLALDPLREAIYRTLMRLYHRAGRQEAAIRQYQKCAAVLRQELGIDPDAETHALYREIVEDRTAPERSIAVLPFDNYSDDPKLNFFALGLTEDLTTALGRVPGLFAIATNSAATFRGSSVSVKQAVEALGVRYVLEGSVQKAREKLRITAQLVDTLSGNHLWVDRFDREAEDVFALQDEIVKNVLVELRVKLTAGEWARVESQGTRNLEAWLLLVEGDAEYREYTREGMVRARSLLERAHKLDPNWAWPLALLAGIRYHEARRGWSASPEKLIRRGIELAERAIEIDPYGPRGYQSLGGLLILRGETERGIEVKRKAIELAPNDSSTLAGLANSLVWLGQEQEAVELMERALPLSPIPPWYYPHAYGFALQLVGRKEEAVEVLEEAIRLYSKRAEIRARLATVYVDLGRLDEANAVVDKLLQLDPHYTASRYLRNYHIPDPRLAAWLKDLLLRAGLPA